MATSPTPLTHHDILAMVEPFARRGRQVDLAASDRLQRCVRFKPVDHAAVGGLPALRETLQLDSYVSGNFKLTRTLEAAPGQQATLQTSGRQPAALLQRVDAVPPQQQFDSGDGFLIARSDVLQPAPGADDAAPAQRVLSRAVVHLDGLSFALSVPAVRGVSADVTLTTPPASASDGAALDLPEDLLAVLGWNWTRLVRKKDHWESKLRLRGSPARRTRRAEAALQRVAAHLAQTLAEPPARYHERHVRARWWAAFRRAIPLLTPISLVITVLVTPRIEMGETPGLWLMLYHVPTALIALSFTLQELPQFEIPPLPKRSDALAWRH